jgi:hypothetical protein
VRLVTALHLERAPEVVLRLEVVVAPQGQAAEIQEGLARAGGGGAQVRVDGERAPVELLGRLEIPALAQDQPQVVEGARQARRIRLLLPEDRDPAPEVTLRRHQIPAAPCDHPQVLQAGRMKKAAGSHALTERGGLHVQLLRSRHVAAVVGEVGEAGHAGREIEALGGELFAQGVRRPVVALGVLRLAPVLRQNGELVMGGGNHQALGHQELGQGERLGQRVARAFPIAGFPQDVAQCAQLRGDVQAVRLGGHRGAKGLARVFLRLLEIVLAQGGLGLGGGDGDDLGGGAPSHGLLAGRREGLVSLHPVPMPGQRLAGAQPQCRPLYAGLLGQALRGLAERGQRRLRLAAAYGRHRLLPGGEAALAQRGAGGDLPGTGGHGRGQGLSISPEVQHDGTGVALLDLEGPQLERRAQGPGLGAALIHGNDDVARGETGARGRGAGAHLLDDWTLGGACGGRPRQEEEDHDRRVPTSR